jgi:hypothetical protein
MENNSDMAYTLRHETSGDRSAAGTAAPTGDPAALRISAKLITHSGFKPITYSGNF